MIEKQSRDKDFKITMSYLEIYNECIKDLLSHSGDVLELREDPHKGITVAGINEIVASSAEEVMALLQLGNRNRTVEATNANETSSRSHAVLQVVVEQKDRDAGTEAEVRHGKLSLIDLAGSERAANTMNRGIRMIEGANINRSLLALGNCINMLSENASRGQKNHVPFRDSKLTRLLKDSLGGNCRTVMIANISPSSYSYEDTHNTLKYANRAKNIKTNAQRNVLNVAFHVSKYLQIISQLKSEIQELKAERVERHLGHISPLHHMSLNPSIVAHNQSSLLAGGGNTGAGGAGAGSHGPSHSNTITLPAGGGAGGAGAKGAGASHSPVPHSYGGIGLGGGAGGGGAGSVGAGGIGHAGAGGVGAGGGAGGIGLGVGGAGVGAGYGGGIGLGNAAGGGGAAANSGIAHGSTLKGHAEAGYGGAGGRGVGLGAGGAAGGFVGGDGGGVGLAKGGAVGGSGIAGAGGGYGVGGGAGGGGAGGGAAVGGAGGAGGGGAGPNAFGFVGGTAGLAGEKGRGSNSPQKYGSIGKNALSNVNS